MLRIKTNPLKKIPEHAKFENTEALSQTGIEMLIALNMTQKTVLTGPEVGIDSKILVTKEPPHFFFNPILSEPKNLQSEAKSSTIAITYTNYLGEVSQHTRIDSDGSITKAINNLNNGITRAKRIQE